ncbi:MAG TPA: ribonuclease E/G, partial [Umezawaea sp.]|nr:ribonuclease E/G [Umezawaea sp.]
TVVDVNTGKFVGSGGNLEQTVTRNNLESAEEIVRQLRLRDIGGIIVIDFIDMVLESNRDLVLRRLTECLGRDRTRHQVAEVTSLGLVQMTRKRVGTGLLEAFSTTCEHCRGRGVVVSTDPVHAHGGAPASAPAAPQQQPQQQQPSRKSRQRNRGGGESAEQAETTPVEVEPVVAEVVETAPAAPSIPDVPVVEPVVDTSEAAVLLDQDEQAAQDGAKRDRRDRNRERRRARRDAGAAKQVQEPVGDAPETVVAAVVEAPAAVEPVAPQPALNGHVPEQAEQAPPTVVAPRRRTSRRAATRPAGPPVGVTEG